MSTPLPEFTKPPVSEVALSVVFAPLDKWRNAHSGMYWGRVQDRYPLTESHPPLPQQIENFDGQQPQAASFRIELFNPDLQRSWFLSDPPTRLLQIQKDRFTVNWRKVKGDEDYPRYVKDLKPKFEQEWDTFVAFLAEQKIGVPEVRQCEVIYVNDIPQGEGWERFADSLAMFAPWWKKESGSFLPLPENLNVAGTFLMPEKAGRLHFTAQRLLRATDGREVVQLQLIARGQPKSSGLKDILAWMDAGHEWIVRGFTDLTSHEAHKIWGRIK
jgi:uncharacterized protein (TIGR04255 family)